jgi:hypothetical protein
MVRVAIYINEHIPFTTVGDKHEIQCSVIAAQEVHILTKQVYIISDSTYSRPRGAAEKVCLDESNYIIAPCD